MSQTLEVQNNDRLSFRDMVLTFKAYRLEIWKNRKWVALLIGLSAALLFFWEFRKPTTFTAKVTFMLSEDSGGSSPLASVLGTFGLGGSDYNMLKLTELCRSRRISEGVLFTKVAIKGKQDFIANHIIRYQELHKLWAKKSKDLKGFYFTRDSLDKFSRIENKALQSLHIAIVGNKKTGAEGMMDAEVSDETQIITLSVEARNEELAIAVARNLYQKLSDFYVSKTIQQEQETFDLMRYKRDSLYRALTGTDYALAKFSDASYNVIKQVPMVPQIQLQRKTGILGTAYAEAVQNTELAEFALSINKPFLQVIDMPIPPLTKNLPSIIKLSIFSLLLGLILSIIIFGGRKFYRDAMKMPEQENSPPAAVE